MPFVHTSVAQGTPAIRKEAIVQGIHLALVNGIGMPDDELFNLVREREPGEFFYSRTFNGAARSDEVVVVEITMRRGRSDAMKQALYANIAANLTRVGVAVDDIFIFMHENDYSDWSVCGGRFAMALVQQRGKSG